MRNMKNRNTDVIHPLLGERLIDAREAAYCLNLPMYWLTHPKERVHRGIPHYRVGTLVRFKLSELNAWLESKGGTHAGLQ